MNTLIRWTPERGLVLRPLFRPFSLLEEVEELARTYLDGSLTPPIDMFEEGKELVIKAELPGVKKEDLNIEVEGDVLTIKAKKKSDKEASDGDYYTRERCFGQFVRYINLPPGIDAGKVDATLENGILEVRLGRVQEPEKKKIEIKAK